MAALSGKSLAVKIGRAILSIGFVISVLALTLTIASIFIDPKNGILFDYVTLRDILIFGILSLVCYLLELRLATGIWCMRSPQNPNVPKFSPSRKIVFSTYAILFLIIALFSLTLAEINGWGGHDLQIVLSTVQMIVIFVTFILLLISILSIMEEQQKFKEHLAQSASPGNENSSSVQGQISDKVPLNILEIIVGLLKNPTLTMKRLKGISFTTAGLYFVIMAGIILLPIALVAILSVSKIPDILFLSGLSFLIIIVGWLFFGLLINVVISVFKTQLNLNQTIITAFFAITPVAIIGWVPIIGNFAFFWAIYLMKCGLEERQDVPEKTAFSAVIVCGMLMFIAFSMLLFIIIMKPAIPVGFFSKR